MTSVNVEGPDSCGVLILDLRSPDFDKFMACGLRFLRDARQITFHTEEMWNHFHAVVGRQLMPWIFQDERLMADIQTMVTGKVVAVGADPHSFLEIREIPGMQPEHMRVMYSEKKARVFNSRIAALKECGTIRDDWWDEVIVGWKEA
ncbi:hypothetical protein Peetri_00054 [Pseudomonas phage vB_PpuM-Peetri]